MIEATSFVISLSGEKAKGNNQGITVPMDPNVIPLNAPTITKDFNSIRAYLIPKYFRKGETKNNQKDNVLKN